MARVLLEDVGGLEGVLVRGEDVRVELGRRVVADVGEVEGLGGRGDDGIFEWIDAVVGFFGESGFGRGGTGMGDLRRKGGQGGFVEDLAHEYRIPLVNLIDGAGGTATSQKRRGYAVFPGLHGFERSAQRRGKFTSE